jgi:hypothetical protein
MEDAFFVHFKAEGKIKKGSLQGISLNDSINPQNECYYIM